MNTNNQLNWWIDQTGTTYTHTTAQITFPGAIAAGKVYPGSKSGVITHLNNKPARPSVVSRELLDVLHKRFPGTRWWIKDPISTKISARQAAS